ncbi:MAG: hypothetical protein LBP63_08155 [Prevotellaceae bacterium]|nr:hypothetical protein [Prevotellaceae bacterium]
MGTIALNVAADDQAIYELIQNADDCKSSFFSVIYNEKYLLCINNGNHFSDNDMSAIINVASNYKEGEDIGTFGIGFKILHRLVGTDDGREAIINNYAGPIIFSWNEYNQFSRFLKGEPVGVYGWGDTKEEYIYEKDKENAWLIKLLYTCFPCNIGERIKLKDYDTDGIKFDREELKEMRGFLKDSLQNVNLTDDNYLKNGSIFFLKLGEGKSKFLDDGIDKIKSGLSYSFKFLNSLKKIYINGEEIKAQRIMDYSNSFLIDSPEFININPKNKKRDIKYTFAYYKDYKNAENLRNELAPNLYTFFSMDEEKNGFSFLLHCNAFDMNNDRRKLQANSQINEKLLPIIANDITQYIDMQKENNRNLFLSLYANLLLSKEPKGKPHINNYFFRVLKDYLHQNIPTSNGYSCNAQNVKIKNTFLEIQPADFDCPEIDWFYWNNEKYDSTLIDEARDSTKLNLDKWNIIDLLKYAVQQNKVDKINSWVKKIESETSLFFAEERKMREADNTQEITRKPKPYYTLLSEINKNILKSNFEFISQIKLFKFSDDNFYSLNEIFESEKLVLNYKKTFDIRYELQNFGFITSLINIDSVNSKDISNYSNIKDLIQTNISDLQLFQKIFQKVKSNTLRKDKKHKLFFALAAFDGVGDEKLKDLELFKGSKGNVCPLRHLLKGDLSVPNWLFSFKIHIAEYTPELDKYLVPEKDIYQSIILKNWDFIISQQLDIDNLYKQTTSYYQQNQVNQRLDKFACIYTNNGFKKPDEIFFNDNLINNRNFNDLRDAIIKLSGKHMPHKNIFYYLIDDKSPFKIFRNDSICKVIAGAEAIKLSYDEVVSLLEFSQQNKEEIFRFVYIQKQNDVFLLVRHSQNIFQYYSDRKEIIELLSNHNSFKLLPEELDVKKLQNSGLWSGRGLYLKILQTVEFSENLLPVIKESDKEVQLEYLSKLKNLSLQEGETYDKNSFEHRCLKMAIDFYGNSFQTDFAHKILINNCLKIKDIAVKDDIIFDEITLSLSSVLPKYKGSSDIITAIINQFMDFTKTELSEKVFYIKNKSKNEILSELLNNFKSLTTIEQFAFVLYYSKQNEKNYFTNDSLSSLSRVDILDFAYKKQFKELGNLVNFINVEILNKIYPSELALETERLPSWILTWLDTDDKQNKLNYLSLLGLNTGNNNGIVSIRKFFHTDLYIDIKSKIYALHQNSDLLVNTFEWLKENEIKLSTPEQFDVFKKVVEVINENRDNGDLVIQEEPDFENLKEKSTEWNADYYLTWKEQTDNKFSIYLYDGALPKTVGLDEIDDYIFYWYNNGDVVLEGNTIYVNKQKNIRDVLTMLASEKENDFTFEDLWKLFNENSKNTENKSDRRKSENKDGNSDFKDDVEEFIKTELEDTEWDEYIPELRSLLELPISQSLEKQKIYNLIAKLKLAKDRNIHFENANTDYNHLENENEKYIVHSARRAFAYIHPKEILKMRDEGYQMALDFSTKTPIRIYKKAEEILSLNTNHMLVFQHEKTMDDLFAFCEANKDENKHLLIVDKDNSRNQSSDIFKLLNPEDDYR